MDYAAAFQISASGMRVEKARMDATALNLANINTSVPPGTTPFSPLRVVIGEVPLGPNTGFGRQLPAAGGVQVMSLVPTQGTPRLQHDASHPHADARGFVAYPAIDHTSEMINMNAALRAYEANVAALNAARAMAARALEIGGQ
jgi:flagellar basal-body rod protein FlgC